MAKNVKDTATSATAPHCETSIDIAPEVKTGVEEEDVGRCRI